MRVREGMGVVSIRRLVLAGLVSLCALCGSLALAGASAQAAVSVEGESVSAVTAESVTFEATINPHGALTTYYVQYGTTSGYGANSPAAPGTVVGSGAVGVEVSRHVQGLSAGTVYHYRVVAVSEVAGHVEELDGPDRTFTTQSSGSAFVLPDGRQYEMVSPPQKQGSLLKSFFFGNEAFGIDFLTEHITVQASVGGNAITDEADQPTEPESQGDANGVSVFMARGSGGWSSRVIAPPHRGEATGVNPSAGGEYRFFSEDLSRGVVQQFGSFTPLSPEAVESTPYLHTDYLNGNVNELCNGSYLSQGSCFEPLVTRGNTAPGTVFGDAINGECDFGFCGPLVIAATPDLSHVILESRRRLTSTPVSVGNFEVGFFAAAYYEWYGGGLQLLNILPGKEEGGGSALAVGEQKHVVSNNGARVLLEGFNPQEPKQRLRGLYLRDVAKGETVQLDAAEAGCGACASGEGAEYVKANSEDSRVFFLDVHKLTSNSGAHQAGPGPTEARKRDLYECEIVEVAGKDRCNLSDLTPETGGEAGTARAVLGASEDGSYVYFAAGGKLAPGATGDEECEPQFNGPGPCNLYVRHKGVTSFIAELSREDSQYYINNGIELSRQRTRVSPNGRWLAFMSSGDLTGNDTRDAVSGAPDEEVYLYDASSNTLACASCDPTGARPVGVNGLSGPVASTVPGWEKYTGGAYDNGNVYQPRFLSNSGRLFFDSKDALVPLDVNGVVDVYEYEPEGVPAGEHACGSASGSGSVVFKPAHGFEAEGRRGEEGAGCVALISSGTSPEESTFLDASETGGDVFFTTSSKLAPQDFDHAYDIYDAQECTSVIPCAPVPAEQPPPCETEGSCRAAPAPQPSIYGAPSSATFNGTGNLIQTPPSSVAPHTKKAAKCRKGFVKKKGRCVKARSKRARRARAGNERRGK
jgi:hypothetical protein